MGNMLIDNSFLLKVKVRYQYVVVFRIILVVNIDIKREMMTVRVKTTRARFIWSISNDVYCT